MGIAKEGWPFILGALVVPVGAGLLVHLAGWPGASWCALAAVLLTALMLFFFRDPTRDVVAGPLEMVSGADGLVRSVTIMEEPLYLKTEAVRISVFLSIFDVHVNRTPMGGRVEKVDYQPGRHLFAFLDGASKYNEHSSILVRGEETDCLVRQIVGPVARRVVCRLKPDEVIATGDRVGIMKFGSRLDVFFPKDRVTVEVSKGDRVVAGKTVIARLKAETNL